MDDTQWRLQDPEGVTPPTTTSLLDVQLEPDNTFLSKREGSLIFLFAGQLERSSSMMMHIVVSNSYHNVMRDDEIIKHRCQI